jgi:alcohol dehydrogenase class IV
MDSREKAKQLLTEFKGDTYSYGLGVYEELARHTAELGKRALFVGRLASPWFAPLRERALKALADAGVEVVGECRGAYPNAPLEDVYRMHSHIMHKKPDVIVTVDGGSGIDAVKSAVVLAALGDVEPEIDPFFGMGKVAEALEKHGRTLLPTVSVMLAASSAAHLTKYSNVTDNINGQKYLVIDEAVTPTRAVFDYEVTSTQPASLTQDGAFDGIGHCVEVYFGAGPETEEKCAEICEAGVDLVIRGLLALTDNPDDKEARMDLGLGTDLGGQAIMVGGTSGPHLNSFSLVDVVSHGRACALMEPYYTVFFAPAIEHKVRRVGEIYRKHGLITEDLDALSGRELGEAVARGMRELSLRVGFPEKLSDLPNMTREHITRCLEAAKNPALESKLKNMPVPLNADLVDEYMGPVLEAGYTGDFAVIKNM